MKSAQTERIAEFPTSEDVPRKRSGASVSDGYYTTNAVSDVRQCDVEPAVRMVTLQRVRVQTRARMDFSLLCLHVKILEF